MKKILLVDDDAQILNALARVFSETDYIVYTAESAGETLNLMEAYSIDLIICDMRMPIFDGFKLLSIIKEKYPKVIRVILSGYAEEKQMSQALLHNIAMLYVFKPWNHSDLLNRIKKLFTEDAILHSEKLLIGLQNLDCCNVIPSSCLNMFSLIEEEASDALIDELVKTPDISALLVQVAKSAVYGVMPDSAAQAAKYLGLPNMKTFLHFACLMNSIEENTYFKREAELLLEHAFLTNRIFLFIYETFLHKQPPEATLFAGLMHNAGLILLLNSLSKHQKPQPDIRIAELEHSYPQHQEIGAYFLAQWDLPFPMHEVSLFHHKPLDPSIIHHELVSVIYIAQTYAWKLSGTSVPEVFSEIFHSLDISVNDFETRLSRYLKQEFISYAG